MCAHMEVLGVQSHGEEYCVHTVLYSYGRGVSWYMVMYKGSV